MSDNNNTLSFPERLPPEPTPSFEPPPSSGLNFHEILFIFSRHKLKIGFFILIGLSAAAAIFFLLPAPFESQAKLLVRYVVERSTVDTMVNEKGNEQGPVQPVGAPSEAILNSEVEILTSSDLALQVAQTIGPRRILDPGPSPFEPLKPLLTYLHLQSAKPAPTPNPAKMTVEEAAIAIRKALEVHIITGSNIISVTYTDKNPKLAVEILNQIVQRYLEKHLEVHRSAGTFAYVTKEAERLGIELAKTENELKKLKDQYNVTTILETTANNSAELLKTQTDLDTTESDLATQKVRLAEIDKFFHGKNTVNGKEAVDTDSQLAAPDNETVNHYQTLISEVDSIRKSKADLLTKFAPGSAVVRSKQIQLDEFERQKVALENKYPALLTTTVPGTGLSTSTAAAGATDIILERARLAGLETHETELKNRLVALKKRATTLSDIAPKIADLERTRETQDTSYRYYQSSLEKARIDEGLNPSRMPNISVVQNPSPAMRAIRDLKKVVIGLAGGSIVLGLGIALFIELILDRTVKRPRELETRLALPLMLTIPVLPKLTYSNRLRLKDAEKTAGIEPSLEAQTGLPLRPFCESIRDRLGFYFAMNNMAHKPKLVAITGLSKAAGVSSLAAGLADTLTDAENKVVLIQEQISPKRFYNLLNEFKASDLDYVVFDMPCIGNTSSTLAMAGFMDKILLVVEAAKSSREAVKRVYAQLSAKADVSVIFNKSRYYGPKWLEGEL